MSVESTSTDELEEIFNVFVGLKTDVAGSKAEISSLQEQFLSEKNFVPNLKSSISSWKDISNERIIKLSRKNEELDSLKSNCENLGQDLENIERELYLNGAINFDNDFHLMDKLGALENVADEMLVTEKLKYRSFINSEKDKSIAKLAALRGSEDYFISLNDEKGALRLMRKSDGKCMEITNSDEYDSLPEGVINNEAFNTLRKWICSQKLANGTDDNVKLRISETEMDIN